jgi:hypothetical protein
VRLFAPTPRIGRPVSTPKRNFTFCAEFDLALRVAECNHCAIWSLPPMSRLLVRIESVNLDVSVFDTDDLSTIRGGSYANLLAPGDILRAIGMSGLGNIEPVFEGASQALGIMESPAAVAPAEVEDFVDSLSADPARSAAMFPHLADVAPILPSLCIVCAATALGDDDFDLKSARTVNRIRVLQLKRPTIDNLFDDDDRSATRFCAIDGLRPGMISDHAGDEDIKVSKSVAARRKFGRALRQKVYARILGDKSAQAFPPFADSFSDLLPPEGVALPPLFQSKMAVISIDGNRFGKIRGKHRGVKAVREFSRTVRDCRATLLERLVASLTNDPLAAAGDKIKFETLLWGGDEALFVAPAWKVRDIVALLAEVFEDPHWIFRGDRLTHSVGIVVCHYKMPIATARSLAEAVMQSAKNAARVEGDNSLSLQFFQSIEPPSSSLRTYRSSLYYDGEDKTFAIVGTDRFKEFIELGKAITDTEEGFPRSQLMKIVRKVDLNSMSAEELRIEVEKSLKRSAIGETPEQREEWISEKAGQLASPVFGNGNMAVGLMRLAEFWEMFHPVRLSSRELAA